MAHQRVMADLIHPFEEILSVSAVDIEFELRGHNLVPWAEYLLNPRRLCGSDFLMRWTQGVWSEERLTEAINETGRYVAFPYGPSGTAPDEDVRAFALYFERLEAAGLGQLKRPDLLIFRDDDKKIIEEIIQRLELRQFGGHSIHAVADRSRGDHQARSGFRVHQVVE